MENLFIIDTNDKNLSIKFKTEANIKLASVKNDIQKKDLKIKYQKILHIIKAIEYNDIQTFEDINFILEIINTLNNKGILSNLTLNDNEFESIDFNGYFINKRYPSIRRSKETGLIYNVNAFNCYIRAAYDENNNKQIECSNDIINAKRLYFSKGGIITGEYIEDCIIPSNIVKQHEFFISELIEVPVCKIIDKTDIIYVVDHRCPQLKTLAKTYINPVNVDVNIKNKHYNIRKYKKIN